MLEYHSVYLFVELEFNTTDGVGNSMTLLVFSEILISAVIRNTKEPR